MKHFDVTFFLLLIPLTIPGQRKAQRENEGMITFHMKENYLLVGNSLVKVSLSLELFLIISQLKGAHLH